MPHQCVHCNKLIEVGSKELLEGCSECGGRFFYYIRDSQFEKLKNKDAEAPIELAPEQITKIEKDVREMAGITDEEAPVILDFESVRVVGEGKFELDVVNLFNKKRPLVYKLEEGRYIIDLATTLKLSLDGEDKA